MRKASIRILAFLLCGVLLCGCGAGQKAQPTPAPTAVPTVTPVPTASVPRTEAEQRAFIERSRNVWLPQDLQYETWYYAITDLDHNGRLEVITASTQGSGVYTWVNVWEMNESCTALQECPDNTEEGEAWPEIIKESLTSYRDPVSGRWSYVCENLSRDGAAHYYTAQQSFSLDRGQIELKVLASMEEMYTDENNSTRKYFDADGFSSTEQDYNSAVQRAFQGQEQGSVSLSWTQLEPQSAPQPQITPAPQPQYTQQPQPVQQPQFTQQPQVGGPVTITKNPTSESLAAGGKTWFIAHASNASSLTWLLTSPQGQTYTLSQAMQANPGLMLQELPDDTLGVSNVPASVDGWSVQARFDGPGGTAVTAPAMIYVDDTVTAYGAVISSYYRAYTSGNTNSEYAFNNNISEFISYSRHVGYVLQDLNGDGVEELIIAGMLDDQYTDLVLFDLYTLENGQPVQLACSRARNRFFLRSDGSILNEGSNGAGNSIFVVDRIYGSALVPVESAMTWFEGKETDGYYHQTDGYNYEPRDYDEYLSEEQFMQLITYWESSIVFPELTQIA